MFNIDGISGIKKIKWKHLRPGVILLSGATVNGSPIPELFNFPVITEQLLYELFNKYRFLSDREVVIAEPVYNYSPFSLSKMLKEGNVKRELLNQLRVNHEKEKKMLLFEAGFDESPGIPLINTDAVDRDFLIKDTYNSFSYLYGLNNSLDLIPSVFHELDLQMSVGDLLTGKINSKFNIPDDKEVLIHIAVDFSKSMDSMGKLDLVISAVEYFCNTIPQVFKNTKIKLYVFSDSCIPAELPLRSGSLERGDTSYSNFMKKILHFRDRNVFNKIIVFTDGLPTDRIEALKIGGLIKKNSVDYTQIIFDIKDEQRHEIEFPDGKEGIDTADNVVTELTDKMIQVELDDDALDRKMKRIFSEFTEIAEVCGGNQIILKINKFINLVSVECYDRYMGLLTLATREETEKIEKESFEEAERRIKNWNIPGTNKQLKCSGFTETGKQVKKWNFPRV